MLNKKGQNTAEYAILIALVIAAAVGMQTYVKRGLQARVHDETKNFVDKLGKAEEWKEISKAPNVTAIDQYEPTELSKKATQKIIKDEVKSTMDEGGAVTRETTKSTKQGAEDYQKYGY